MRKNTAEKPSLKIYRIRKTDVVLDQDLARFYGVGTGQFNRAVLRNIERFPVDFSFVLSKREFSNLICQLGTSSLHGGRRKLPRVFSEHGAVMASSVLKSCQAIKMSVYVVRAFVEMRRELLAKTEFETRLLKKKEKQDSVQTNDGCVVPFDKEFLRTPWRRIMKNFHDFSMETLEGQGKSLADYKNRVCLAVNVASQCGKTPQYAGLQRLHEKYGQKGLSVLGFPANEFGGQEPGSHSEIRDFCEKNYGVTFDMFAKIVVKGQGIHPLYQWLTQEAGHDGDIPWNFSKFLVGKDGRVLARWNHRVEPEAGEIIEKIEKALAG